MELLSGRALTAKGVTSSEETFQGRLSFETELAGPAIGSLGLWLQDDDFDHRPGLEGHMGKMKLVGGAHYRCCTKGLHVRLLQDSDPSWIG